MKEIINYYNVLGVPENATFAEIKKARNDLIKKYHPDTAENKKAYYEKTEQINSAYRVLSSADLRAKHDKMLRESREEVRNYNQLNGKQTEETKKKKFFLFRFFDWIKNRRRNRKKASEEEKLVKKEAKQEKDLDKENEKLIKEELKKSTSKIDKENRQGGFVLLMFIILIIASMALIIFLF